MDLSCDAATDYITKARRLPRTGIVRGSSSLAIDQGPPTATGQGTQQGITHAVLLEAQSACQGTKARSFG